MGLIRNWVGSWIFNLVGALFVAYFLAIATGILTAPPWSNLQINGKTKIGRMLPAVKSFQFSQNIRKISPGA